ncbi:MAG: GNAT family N-acetyltransferase [Alphaproteobacteria bacterium]|nr:GNAT family N-acetyltransferase [Alphaproteobacteria bacterium]
MVEIRTPEPRDLEAFYAISLATGDFGRDAGDLYRDAHLMGFIYSAPYAVLTPQTCLVAQDDDGVGGYVVGVHDTRGFEARLEQEWWPDLHRRYAEPAGDPAGWTPDERRHHRLHHPLITPAAVLADYPAHVHLNLLPRMQGQGLGRKLLAAWMALMCPEKRLGVHAGLNPNNPGAMAFWPACGFVPLDPVPGGDLANLANPFWHGRFMGPSEGR